MRRALQHAGPFLGWSIAWLVAAGLLVAIAGERLRAAPADRPTWKTLEDEIPAVYTKDRKTANAKTAEIRKMVSGLAPLSGGETAFDEYFQKYLFPKWTKTDPDSLGELVEQRTRFLRELSDAPQPIHDRLTNLTLASMQRILEDPDLHPSVRYNAALVIGALNAREPDRNNSVNPEPLPAALPVLVTSFTSADESDGIRLAALLGILRHLEWDPYRPQATRMPADQKTTIVTELMNLAQATDPPAGRSLEGHTWMRRRAVEGLMYVTLSGMTQEIKAVIEKLVSSDAEPVSLRCAAADVMGRLNYQAPDVPAPEPTAKELGYLALVACNAELKRLDDLQKLEELRSKSAGRMGGMDTMMGMGGGAGGMDQRMRGGVGASPGAMQGAMMGKMGASGGDVEAKRRGGMMGPGMMMGGMMGKKGKQKKSKPSEGLDVIGADGAGGKSSKSADPGEVRLEQTRRRMRAWLFAVQMGLGDEKANDANEVKRSGSSRNPTVTEKYTRGVRAFVTAEQEKAYVSDVIDKTRKLVAVVENPDLDYETFNEDLRSAMDDLEQITKPLETPKEAETAKAAPAAAAADESVPAAKGTEPAAAEVPEAPAAPAAPAPEPGKAAAPTEGQSTPETAPPETETAPEAAAPPAGAKSESP